MTHFSAAITAWDTTDFTPQLVKAMHALGVRGLPLQKALSQGSVALDDDMMVRVLRSEAQDDQIRVKVSIQYTSIIAGCSCADDPTPQSVLPEYCELALTIDRRSGLAEVQLL